MKSGMRVLLISGVILMLGVVGFFALRAIHAPSSASTKIPSVSALRASMEYGVKTFGAEKAYAAFKEKYQKENFEVSHNAAHLFGEALFDAKGVPGVAACDSDFNFGCYHGFFTAAVEGNGLEVVSKLDAACAGVSQSASACQHGIGHGILEYLGHDKLVEALTACGRTNQPDPLAGCTGGVFMEYNVPLVVGENGDYSVQARPLPSSNDLYAPCPTLPNERFQASCYQELAQWWKQVLNNDFVRMGKLCEAVDTRQNKEACFAGIAKMIPSTASYSVEAAEKLCKALPSEWYDSCVMNASWAFETNVGQHADAVRLCAFASKEKNTNCPQ